jgi:spiro-SPASM protein
MQVLETHLLYKAEYTFAEGFCRGLTLVAIDAGALAIIADLAKTSAAPAANAADTGAPKTVAGGAAKNAPVTATCFFDLIAGDINSFEVETVIAEKDYRAHRIACTAATNHGLLACTALYNAAKSVAVKTTGTTATVDLSALAPREICDLAIATPGVTRTVPAFYNIQISGVTPAAAIYSPYSGTGGFMEKAAFSAIVAQAAELSGEAVIGLAAWGEPLAHRDFVDFVNIVAAHPGLSVLVETWGHLVTPDLVAEIAAINVPIDWIVYVDAMDEDTYAKIHLPIAETAANSTGTTTGTTGTPVPTHAAAVAAVDLLAAAFPGHTYAQFTRMHENEHHLEAFYRHYSGKGTALIQKYDHFCGRLANRKPADLSPLDREFCWHHRRDLTILLDGTIPFCRQCSLEKGDAGALKAVWDSRAASAPIDALDWCKTCDEYYTFNF